MVEKEWFDNFLAYKDNEMYGTIAYKDNEMYGTIAPSPGKINNGKLLSCSKLANGGTSSTEVENEQELVGGEVEAMANELQQQRRLRRLKWQGKVEEEKKGDDVLCGNLQCRPELREGIDYVLVGKETWSFISSHFSCDVELPQQQQQQQQPQQLTVSLDTIEMSNSGSDSKQVDMDAGDAGSSVAVARSASSLISDGSSKSDSGDDLVSFILASYKLYYLV